MLRIVLIARPQALGSFRAIVVDPILIRVVGYQYRVWPYKPPVSRLCR